MNSCYTGDHTAGDHMYTDMTTCNTEEPQKEYYLGMVSKRLMGKEGEGRRGRKKIFILYIVFLSFNYVKFSCLNGSKRQFRTNLPPLKL